MNYFSVSEIQKMIEAQVANPEFASALLASLKVSGINSLKDATSDQMAFFFSKDYQLDLFQTKAGLIVTGTAFVEALKLANPPAWSSSVFLVCNDPYVSMALMTGKFSTFMSSHDHQVQTSNPNVIHPTVILGEGVTLGLGIEIGAHSVIESGCKISDGVKIYPQCFIGKGSSLGKGTVLFPKVTLYEKTMIGERCRIHAGTVIGSDGFGYAPIKDPVTKKTVNHQKIYHLGNVVIEDDVEVGANSTIDRGTFGSTRIHTKVKIDNLVQIGHNSEIGEGSILCGEVGIGGSSTLGKFCVLAGQAGLANSVNVGDYSFLAAYTGVTKDWGPGSQLTSVPARPIDEHYKILALQNKLLRDRKKDRKK